MDFSPSMKWLTLDILLNALSQDLPLDEVVDELRDFDDRFKIILRKHIAALGWWSLLILAVGVPGMMLTSGFWLYFLMMSAVWAVINFSIVLFIFDHIYYVRFRTSKPFKRFGIQHHVEKMLLLNVGLDIAYVFAGLWLMEIDSIEYEDWCSGFGVAVLVQGVYLFFLDHLFHWLHLRNIRKARPFLESMLEKQISYQASKRANPKMEV